MLCPHSSFLDNKSMEIATTVKSLLALDSKIHELGKTVGFVSTGGALHEGHKSLIRAARKKVDVLVVSIFINPKEFSLNERYGEYPRAKQSDLAVCEELGVDCVFSPQPEDMYPAGYATTVNESDVTQRLCGKSRTHYFAGVLTVQAKLFNLVNPDYVFYGQKDAQKIAAVRRLISDLHFKCEIVVCPTVREESGLAFDVRNDRFSPHQLGEAAAVFQAMKAGKEMVEKGVRSPDRVKAEVIHMLSQVRRIRIIYVEIVTVDTMEDVREIVPGETLVTCAVWVDEVRLVDNVLF